MMFMSISNQRDISPLPLICIYQYEVCLMVNQATGPQTLTCSILAVFFKTFWRINPSSICFKYMGSAS